MKKRNRRSQLHKRERHSQTARVLLDSFHWEWDQRVLLELAATGEFTVDEIREFRWNQFRLGIQCIIILEKELFLPEEVFAKIEDALKNEIDLMGHEWKTPEDKIFTHQTGKEIYKEIISYKE